MKRKLVWKIMDAPTGRYRSFHRRGWPSASFNDDYMIGLSCEDDYRPANVKIGEHKEIRIRITDRQNVPPGGGSWVLRTLKQQAKTLKEAKVIAQKFFDENPDLFGLEVIK